MDTSAHSLISVQNEAKAKASPDLLFYRTIFPTRRQNETALDLIRRKLLSQPPPNMLLPKPSSQNGSYLK